MIIAFDVDGVLANLVTPWLRKYNFLSGDHLKTKDIKTFWIEDYVLPEWRDKFITLLTPDLYDQVKPYPGAMKAVKAARKLGRVIFVTSSALTPGRKFTWLNDWGFDVKRNDYVECTDKSLIKCDVLVDDFEGNFFNVDRGILFNRRWNEEVVINTDRYNVVRCKNYRNLIKLLEEM